MDWALIFWRARALADMYKMDARSRLIFTIHWHHSLLLAC